MMRFFLRRYAVEAAQPELVWYEIIEKLRASPLGVAQERRVCVLHSKTTGDLLVDELNRQKREGIVEGMTRYAWMRDGISYVGTTGQTLKRAIEDLDKEPF